MLTIQCWPPFFPYFTSLFIFFIFMVKIIIIIFFLNIKSYFTFPLEKQKKLTKNKNSVQKTKNITSFCLKRTNFKITRKIRCKRVTRFSGHNPRHVCNYIRKDTLSTSAGLFSFPDSSFPKTWGHFSPVIPSH